VGTAGPLLGDLREREDGGFDGWCWAPDRPNERLIVELLVNDTPAASMVAAVFRPDLLALGCGDGRHGFVIYLPPNVPVATDDEYLVTARERKSGRIFGRLLRRRTGLSDAFGRVSGMSEAVAALSQDLAALREKLGASPASRRMKKAFGRLGDHLAVLGRGPGSTASGVPTMATSHIVTLVSCPVNEAAALSILAALAPALAEAKAEILLAIAGTGRHAFLLPPAPANVRYLRGPCWHDPGTVLTHAAKSARGRWLVLFDAGRRAPSAAALLALCRELDEAAPATLIGARIVQALGSVAQPIPDTEPLALPAPLGFLIGADRDLWPSLGPGDPAAAFDVPLACAEFAMRARLLGRPWRIVQEPRAEPALPKSPASAIAGRAAARLHQRWNA
jgi:hypothetical protein